MLQAAKQVNGLQHAGVQVAFYNIFQLRILVSCYSFQWYHEEYLMGRDLKLVEPVRCVSAHNFSTAQNVLEIPMDWVNKRQ